MKKLIFIVILLLFSCVSKKTKIEKLKEKKDQIALKQYQKAIKTHHKIQSKSTRKRMKASVKKVRK